MNMLSLKLRNPLMALVAIAFLLISTSCGSTKNIKYFNDIQDTKLKNDFSNLEPVIQINDILSINVTSQDKNASELYNAPNESSFNISTSSASSGRLTIGYLVNQKGEITFPSIGALKVSGMTKQQLTEYLTNQLASRGLLREPIVTIRLLNYRISVLGEVAKPGVFSVPNEKLSLLEALSFAGDITIYGRRDNVLLIRENDKGEKTIKRVDLTSQEILNSPYYYLQSNDILYVEPAQNRLAREKTNQTLPIVLSALSLVIIGITSFK